MDMLRDPLWQFVGAVVAVLALVLSVVIALAQRQRKRLGYDIETATPVLTMREELAGRLKVLLDDAPVEDLGLYILRISNHGNVPIRPADYDRPIKITFGADSQILSAEVTEQRPSNLGAAVTFDSSCVTIQPLLLNARDSFQMKCLVTRAKRIEVEGRLAGVSRIESSTSALSPSRVLLGFVGLLMFVAGPFLEVSFRDHPGVPRFYELMCVAFSTVGLIIAAFCLPFDAIFRRFLRVNRGVMRQRRIRHRTEEPD
jgi:hypothetical protein